MKDFVKEAYYRFSAQTPVFFRKIVKTGVGIGVAGGGLVAPSLSSTVHWPEFLVKIGSHMVVIGAVAASISKFACQDPDSLPTKNSQIDLSPKN